MLVLKNERWLSHPWSLNENVCQLDVTFLKSISNPKVTDFTDLLSGEIVHQSLVWQDIKKNGLQEPLLIVIGYDQRSIRLESGNHRVNTAIADGYTHLPVAVMVLKESMLNSLNGTHFYNAFDLLNWSNIIKCSYPYQIDPKKVIPSKYIL